MKISFKNGKLDVLDIRICLLGVNSLSKEVIVDGKATGVSQVSYDSVNKVLGVSIGTPFVKGFSVRCSS